MAAVWVRVSPAAALAIPRSISFTRPSGMSMMLAGLTSRWTSPRAWAAARAAHTSAVISAARPG